MVKILQILILYPFILELGRFRTVSINRFEPGAPIYTLLTGGKGGQILLEAEVFEVLCEAKAESDLTETEDSWVNNKKTNL